METSFKLLNSNNFNKDNEINIIPTIQLTKERQKYLYSQIRQYIDEPYKDIYCA